MISAFSAVQGKIVRKSRVRGNGPFEGNNVAHVVLRAHWILHPVIFGSRWARRAGTEFVLKIMMIMVCTKMLK